MIKLTNNSILDSDIKELCEWLQQTPQPQLTQGKIVEQFEQEFSKHQQTDYSVMCNSGSSANLLMLYVLKLSRNLRNNKVIVPALSWSTTISPVIQLGMEPIFCDADKNNLGCDFDYLKYVVNKYNPSVLMIVNVLGIPNEMEKIISLCKDNKITIVEDNCESEDSKYDNVKTGNFGVMSSFSFYFSHCMTTTEGGCVCTKDKDLNNILRMVREHGWTRNTDKENQEHYKNQYEISDFKDKFTFYYPSFNFRMTEIQAFFGLQQLKQIDSFCKNRNNNFKIYQENIKNSFWKINPNEKSYCANFAYPYIHPKIDNVIQALKDNDIETRPLIAGNMMNQPFVQKYFNYQQPEYLQFADTIDKFGIYLPNHPALSESDIKFICGIVNKAISD
jgi:CDP-6-deoxy-D-xylo-4-hexulose-3-dehydrase